eukprot:GFYU01009287.1.p1 GENE.GFYU01009287.1~~GFYU01009287.1.p1  ORF type:complete len:343 (+),score=45.30 GFYU01009287.1:127-1155(+)
MLNHKSKVQPAFIMSIQEGRISELQQLAMASPSDCTYSIDETGTTLLQLAVSCRQVDCVEILCNYSDVNAQDKKGTTALHLAAELGHRVTTEILLRNKANVNQQDEKGQSALYWAAYRGHVEVCDILLRNGANINITDKDGRTPLHMAVVFNKGSAHDDVVAFLVSHNADLEVRNKEGETALFWACCRATDSLTTVRTIAEAGSKIDSPDGTGRTTVHIAAYYKNNKLMSYLLDKGANINALTDDLISPLWWGVFSNNAEGVSILLAKGADVNQRDNLGRTPLMLAKMNNQKVICRHLISAGAEADEERNKKPTGIHAKVSARKKSIFAQGSDSRFSPLQSK